MRWVPLLTKSFATGVLAIVLSLIALLVTLQVYGKYFLHLGPNESVGWDPVSLLGHHWKLLVLAVPVLIFLAGSVVGFLFFSRSVTGR